jgi:subtilisin family serine protease
MRTLILFLISVLLIGCNSNKDKTTDYNKTILIQKEPLYQEQWALHYDKPFYNAYEIDKDAHIHGEETMSRYSGRGVKVGIIDLAIDANHSEYKSNLLKVINSRDGSSTIKCNDMKICYHGTAVAGVIASNINGIGLRGIAPKVDLTFINLDLKGFVSDSEILDALFYVEKEKIEIVNCSWGTGDVSPTIQEKIDELATKGRDGKGVIFVFATGNKGKELDNDESMLESVIGVGSTDEENLRAIYSNFGRGIDIVAPGGYVLGLTTTYGQDDVYHPSDFMRAEDYDKFQGTSASTPIVTASIALLLEANSNLTRQKVQEILQKSSDKIGTVEYLNGYNDYYGYGKINLDEAYSTAL